MGGIGSAKNAGAICLAGLLLHHIIRAIYLLIPQKQASQGSIMAINLEAQGTSFRKDVAIMAFNRKHKKG